MAAVSMVRQVLFLISVSVFFLNTTACNLNEINKDKNITFQIIDANNSSLKMNKDGIWLYNHQLFSGIRYQLFSNNTDTQMIQYFKNGQQDGSSKKYYESGQIQEERYFTKGLKQGKMQTWWENGQLRLEYYFDKNEYNGVCREWSSTGVLTKEMTYENGIESGSQKLFYDNGKIKSNYVVKNGRQYGLVGTKKCINISDRIGNQ